MSQRLRAKHLLVGQSLTAYKKCLTREGIPFKEHYYYVLRANQFLMVAEDRDPRKLEADEISGMLSVLGRDNNLADWQFAQLVDAVRIFLSVYLQSCASGNVDWSYWKSSASNVSGDHATTAREHSPDELVYLKVKKGGW